MSHTLACEVLLLSRHRVSGIERYALDVLDHAHGPLNLLVGASNARVGGLMGKAFSKGWTVTSFPFPGAVAGPLATLYVHRLHTIAGVHFFSVAPSLPIPSKPFSLTLHDVSAWVVPHTMSRGMQHVYRPLIQAAIKSSRFRGIVTVSEFSKQEIIKQFSLPSDRVAVVHQSLDYLRDLEPQVPAGANQPFLLHVGTLEPRKNLHTLVGAFKTANLRRTNLYLVGRRGWGTGQLIQEIQSDTRIRWFPNVTDTELVWFYRNAAALVSTSLYEGVGLPVGEALALGCPAIVSPIETYTALFSNQPHCLQYRSFDELVDALRNPPTRATSCGYELPRTGSFDDALRCLHG